MNDTEISTLVTRLARPHSSGGVVIERAAILAAGPDSPAIIDWIMAHSGTAETAAPSARGGRGLHGSRISGGDVPAPRLPQRFVLPADAARPPSPQQS
jgi:hypothetical protein